VKIPWRRRAWQDPKLLQLGIRLPPDNDKLMPACRKAESPGNELIVGISAVSAPADPAPFEPFPFYRLRHAVKPGITGWAQVHYNYCASVDDTLLKLKYDFYQIKNQSFFLDLVIVLKTVGLVLGFKGR
jgi:hypothetical protein